MIAAYEAIKDYHFSSELYEPGFEGARQIISLWTIGGQLASYKAHLSKECFMSLKMTAETLPDEIDEVSEEQLAELLADVYELKEKIKDGDFPDFVKSFIYGEIAIIESAISDYSIIGAKAFRHGVNEVLIHTGENKDIVKQNKDTEEIKLLIKMWKKMVALGG